MRALLLDPIVPELAEDLQAIGLDISVAESKRSQGYNEELAEAQILIVATTRVTRRMIEQGTNLSLIITAASTADGIDLTAASERGICVSVCARHDSYAKAEFLWGAMLNMDRDYGGSGAASSLGFRGRTLGLVGFGEIGQLLTGYATAFGMQVKAFADDLTPTRASEKGVRACESAEALFSLSDVVILLPKDFPSDMQVSAAHLAELPESGMLLANTRASTIDLTALAQAVSSGRIRCAIDTSHFDDEELTKIAELEGASVSYDKAASTEQARRAAAAAIIDTLHSYLRQHVVRQCVNLRENGADTTLVVRHQNAVGVLAGLLQVLARENINIVGVQTVTLEGEASACTHLAVSSSPTPSTLRGFRRSDAVFEVTVVQP